MSRLPNATRASIRFFAFFLANGTLDVDVAGDVDLRAALVEPSWVEQATVVFVNVLDVDDDGTPRNEGQAMTRAAQYLRVCLDNTYGVEPPFEEWELELPM